MKSKQKNILEGELDIILRDILNVSKNIKLKIWLEAGTFLGFMRDNNYIPWENDIDLGLWNFILTKEKYKKFKKEMTKKSYIVEKNGYVITVRKQGFKCYADVNIYKKMNKLALVNIFLPISKLGLFFNRLLILLKSKDIFKTLTFHHSLLIKISYILLYYIFRFFIPSIFKKKNIELLNKLKKKNSLDYSWSVPLKFLSKLKKTRFRNFPVLIPHKSKEYMRFRYGKDWKIPRSNWKPWIEDKTMTVTNKK